MNKEDTTETLIEGNGIDYLFVFNECGITGEHLSEVLIEKSKEGWECFSFEWCCPWFKRYQRWDPVIEIKEPK